MNAFDDKREFSGRFQVRIDPEVHRNLFNFSNGMNCSINDIVELSAIFSISQRKQEFMEFVDDYLNGSVMVVENHHPIAHLVRRNVLSFSRIDDKLIEIDIKVKRGTVWKRASVVADLEQNPNLLNRLEQWSSVR